MASSGDQPSWSGQNKALSKVGDTSGSRSLSSLLSERINVNSRLTAGSSAELRSYTQLNNLKLNNTIFVPTLLNHDVTLGHHLNAKGSVSDAYDGIPPGSVPPGPTVTPRTDMEGNRAPGGPEPAVKFYIDPVTIFPPPIIFHYSCDTAGYIGFTGVSDTQGQFDGFTVILNDPYWLSLTSTQQGTVPVINIIGREKLGSLVSYGNGATPGGVVISQRDQWSYLWPANVVGPGDKAYFEYFNVGTRVADITEDDLITIL